MNIESILGGKRNEIAYDLDWRDYRSSPGLNPSTIVHGLKSLKHLLYAWNEGYGDSDDLLWGRAVHALLFEPKSFEQNYSCYTEGKQRRGKTFDAFKFDNPGKEILTRTQWASAIQAAQSFVQDGEVQEIISSGKAEVTLFKVVEGLQCRGRVDWIATERSLVDLKTTKDISPRSFGADFFRYGYNLKLGLYRRWLSELTGRHWPVEVIALEKTPPYDIAVIPIADAILDQGAEKGYAVIKQVREAIDSGDWPGIGRDYTLEIPHYVFEDAELEGALAV